MSDTSTSVFEISNWDEEPLTGMAESPKMTRAKYLKVYDGDLVGKGQVEQLAVYSLDGNGTFTALERFEGSFLGKVGTMVLRHEGVFAEGVVKSTWAVVPGVATGALVGLTGSIDFEASHASSYPIVFLYDF